MGNSMNELEQVIRHLEAMAATMTGLTKLLRQMAARPWPDYPNGEGVAGLTESETLQGRATLATCEPPAPGEGLGEYYCACGHRLGDHDKYGACSIGDCNCIETQIDLTDPRD
jgi:hypothetical protein